MQLTRLDLTNFRAFPQASISLLPNGLTLIAGPNNAGKSVLVSAVELLRGNGGGDGWLHSGTDEFMVTAEFQLNDDDRHALLQGFGNVSNPQAWLQSPSFQSVEWTFHSVRGRSGLIGTRLAATNPQGNLQVLAGKDSAQTGELHVADISQQLKLGVVEGAFPGALMRAGSSYVDAFTHFGVYPAFAALLATWGAGVYHFLPLRTGTQRELGMGSVEQLSPDGANLGHVLVNLRTNDEDGWNQLTEIMQELVPEVGRLQVSTGANVRVEFRDATGYRLNLKDLGTGVEQLLMTALVGVRHPRGGLLIIEEPETNLHPEAQRGLLARLQSWSKDIQIIVTTHSTVFLDRAFEGKSQVWLVKRNEGQSRVQKADDTLLEVFRALGVRPAHILSAEGVLLVEGDTDASVLEGWFGSELRRHRIAIIAAQGGDRAWNAEDLVAWVNEATTLRVPTLFIRDRDELSLDVIEKLQAGPVRVLRLREVENYLLHPASVGQVLRDRLTEARLDTEAWPDERIERELRIAADQAQDRVILKRVAARLAPIRQLSRHDVNELIEQGISRKATLDRIAQNVRPASGLEQIWDEEEQLVQDAWDDEWSSLAAGSDVLGIVWEKAGLRYDKKKDTVRIARLVPPPDEFRAIVSNLLAAVDRMLQG